MKKTVQQMTGLHSIKVITILQITRIIFLLHI
jgi:hypothetical protein